MSDKDRFHFEETDTGVRRIAARIGEAVAEMLRGHATVLPADVSPRPRREKEQWRSEVEGNGSSDPTRSENSGESLWSDVEAKEIVTSIRRKKKRGK